MSAEKTFEIIMAAVQAADRDRALSLAVEAWKSGDRQPLVLMLSAERLEIEGKFDEALRLLQEATAKERDEPELWRRFGLLLTRFGRLPDAVSAFEQALDIDPDNLPVLLAAGDSSYRSGTLRKALGFFERADRLQPGTPDVLAAIAAVYAGLQDGIRAREFAERALEGAPANQTAHVALARAELLSGHAERAAARASGLLKLKGSNQVLAMDILAEALDAMNRPAQAFEAYRIRNSLVEKSLGKQIPRFLERRVDQARRITHWLELHDVRLSPGSDAKGSPSAGHIFLLGFPRSGTTLLEKSLSGHPQILTLPEIDFLQDASAAWLANEAAMDQLFGADPETLKSLAEGYWAGVQGVLGETGGKVIVDKLPLHSLSLPLIALLFPEAKILFAVRDPRDVVLSCFRRRFQLNSAMYEFLQLDRTARFYDAVMALALTSMKALPLKCMEVRHEAVVADFGPQMKEILAFAGLEMNGAVHDFAQRAQDNPRTPSDLQLLKGLNKRGLDQWRRYRAELVPVLPILDPWVAHFGYPPA